MASKRAIGAMGASVKAMKKWENVELGECNFKKDGRTHLELTAVEKAADRRRGVDAVLTWGQRNCKGEGRNNCQETGHRQ